MPSFLNKFRRDEDGDMDASPPGEQEKPKVGLAQVTGGTGLDKMLGEALTSKLAGTAAPAAGAAAGAGGAAGGMGGLGAMAGGAGGLGSVIPMLTMATAKGAGKAAHQANVVARGADALADFGRKLQGLPSLNRPDPTDKYGMFGFGLGQALAGIGGQGPAVTGNVETPGPAQALDLGGLAGAPKGGAAAALAAAGKPDDGPMGPPMPPGWMPGTPRGPRAPQLESRVTPGPWINKTPQTFDEPGRPKFSTLPGGDMDLGQGHIGGEFNIDTGPGLGGAVRKQQMGEAIGYGDKAGDLAGILAAANAGRKMMTPKAAPRPAAPPPPAAPRSMAAPSGAPAAAPGASSGGTFWKGDAPLTPAQRADWGAGQFGSRANTVPAGTVPGRGPMLGGGGGGSMSVSPSAPTMTIPAGPPAMTNVPWTIPNAGAAAAPRMPLQSGVGTIPMGAAPTVIGSNPELVAAAVRSGAIPRLMGESVEAAVARILAGGG